MIKTSVQAVDIFKHKTGCLILLCPEKKLSGILKQIDGKLNGVITDAFAAKRFEGKLNQTLLQGVGGAMAADAVLLVGLGKTKDITEEQIRQAAGTSGKLAEKSKFQTLSFYLPDGDAGKVSKSRKGKSGDPVAN